jgi:iron(III) transport system permease protein
MSVETALQPIPPETVTEGQPAPRRPIWSRITGRGIAITAIVVIVLYMVLGPLLMLVFSSFRDTTGALPFEPDVPFTFDNYVRVFTSRGTYDVLLTTLLYSFGALVVSFGLSLTLAWFVERTDMPFRGFVTIMVIAALGLPGVISSIAWVLLLSPRAGMINQALRGMFGIEGEGPVNIYTLPGMIFVQGVALVPITFLLVAAAFKASDAGVEEAGATSGARFRRVMRKITLPLLAPALLSALVYQFVSVVESFDVPLVIGLPADIRVLSTEIYSHAAPAGGLPNFGRSAAYSVLLIAIALGPLLLYNKVIKHSDRYATLSGHSHRSRRLSLGAWRWPAFGGASLIIMIIFVLPAAVMVWTSLQPFYAMPSADSFSRITLQAYDKVLNSSAFQSSLVNTLLMAIGTALLTMVLGLLVSWILVRTRSPMRTPLDVIAFTPHAMPGVIIGLSVLLIYLFLPIPLYGTVWIMVIALSTQWLALSSRLMTGGIAQIRADLEEVSATSGAGWSVTMRKIVLPLVMPAFLNGLVLIFLMAVKNLTIPLILFTPRTNVLATTVWQQWEHGDTSGTAAIGVIMVSVTLVFALLYWRLNKFTFADKM